MEKQSPVGRIWQLGEAEHGKLITAVVLAVVGSVCGMVPYFAAAKIIALLLAGESTLSAYTPWLITALCGFWLRTVLYNGALSISHKATYSILKTIRQQLLAKLPKLPLGTVMDTSSGKFKQTTVGQVDEILNAEEQQHSVTPVTFAGHDIVLDHVSFGYHDDKEILHDVSLSIPAGRMTALVGPSGSGKSTIAKLAAGFWDVKTGSITLGGRDLKDIPLAQLYEQTAFVSQDNYLFDDTVRENIRMGHLSATDAEVEAAAHAAGCDSFIGELEHGYDTMVGGGGAHLSGGERQRIAIARAMLKDAPIVILDEATANVDPENEDRLQKAIEALTRDKTIIMIAHRLKTVRHADQILVVDHGRIVQQGTHEQLIGQPGIYAAFVGGRQQAEGWKL